MSEHRVKIDYQDLIVFVERIEEKAMEDDCVISTIDELKEYMEENHCEGFEVISRYPDKRSETNE
ncbi:hypothetical protein [Virgibacillus sp. Bac332]|uniref:hypothetical protein n=1 Tax=Virgibacillus sp. Bac332 TaxID=2419842 RepID=UPI000EF49BF4|nr:hypothetical protein [Virgibacillus sp. Bac332]